MYNPVESYFRKAVHVAIVRSGDNCRENCSIGINAVQDLIARFINPDGITASCCSVLHVLNIVRLYEGMQLCLSRAPLFQRVFLV